MGLHQLLTHVLMCTHCFVMLFGLGNPLKNHLIMWQLGQVYPCLFRANLVCVFLQQYQRNKGVTNRTGCHNRNGRHSLPQLLLCQLQCSSHLAVLLVVALLIADNGDRRVECFAEFIVSSHLAVLPVVALLTRATVE